jgi:hypothetical protein
MKQAISKLKQLIKADAEQARAITGRVASMPRSPETGPERDKLWCEKRQGRPHRRARLLAYAMLRGIDYARVEPHCIQAPHEYGIYQALRSVVPDLQMTGFSRERIESWLLGRSHVRVEAA